MFSIPKNKKPISRELPGFEESEHRTPKAGYILLIAMCVASLFFGWRAVDDLRDVPAKPPFLSACARPFVMYNWEDRGRYGYEYYPPEAVSPVYYDASQPLPAPEISRDVKPIFGKDQEEKCSFSRFENTHDIPQLFEKRKAVAGPLNVAERELENVRADLLEAEREYNLGLQENIAREKQKLYSLPELQKKIEALRIKQLELQTNTDKLRVELKPLNENLKTVYQGVLKDYRSGWRWYEFKVFLLEALFVFPFFLCVLWLYYRLFAKHSPYTIIVTALLGVASVLTLRVLIAWFWSLFLARILETIWEFVQSFALLKSLIFYGGMLFSIVIFGGAVYILQKRIFDPMRVALRRLRQKQCPRCQTSLDLAADFCPNCGRRIREICTQCGNARYSGMPWCPHCGAK